MAKSAYDVTERSVCSHMFSRFWTLVEGGGFQIFEYVRAQKGRVQFLPPKERRLKLLKLYVIVVWTVTYGVLCVMFFWLFFFIVVYMVVCFVYFCLIL
jgi:hypothetical protein